MKKPFDIGRSSLSRRNLLKGLGVGAPGAGAGLYGTARAHHQASAPVPGILGLERTQVGEVEITMIKDTALELPSSALAVNAPEGAVAELLGRYNLPTETVAASANVLLLRSGGEPALKRTLSRLAPLSLSALLLTLVLLFGLQGEQIIAQPLVILLLAVPILIQVYLNAGLAYWLNRRLGSAWCVAGPSALIGASNFFELAVAAAIALFGFQSGAALATVVGVLVEVPVMLSVVHIVRRTRGWYERGAVDA